MNNPFAGYDSRMSTSTQGSNADMSRAGTSNYIDLLSDVDMMLNYLGDQQQNGGDMAQRAVPSMGMSTPASYNIFTQPNLQSNGHTALSPDLQVLFGLLPDFQLTGVHVVGTVVFATGFCKSYGHSHRTFRRMTEKRLPLLALLDVLL